MAIFAVVFAHDHRYRGPGEGPVERPPRAAYDYYRSTDGRPGEPGYGFGGGSAGQGGHGSNGGHGGAGGDGGSGGGFFSSIWDALTCWFRDC